MNANQVPNNRLEAALREYGERAAFSPMFADRIQSRIQSQINAHVASRVEHSPLDAFAEELVWLFRRTVLVGACLAAMLAWYNLSFSEDLSLFAAFGVADVAEDVQESAFMLD